MEEKFKIQIVTPEKIVFDNETEMATLPSYEGNMDILKNHIPIITFLKPGIVKIKKNDENHDSFFVEDGIVEFFNNFLSILSSTAINTQNIQKTFLEDLNKVTEEKLKTNNLSDEERYLLNHKLDTIKSINI